MPLFKPFAGFSPNCWVVLVQIEHWADERIVHNKQRIMNRNMKNNFFMKQIYKIMQPLCSFSLPAFFSLPHQELPFSYEYNLELLQYTHPAEYIPCILQVSLNV